MGKDVASVIEQLLANLRSDDAERSGEIEEAIRGDFGCSWIGGLEKIPPFFWLLCRG